MIKVGSGNAAGSTRTTLVETGQITTLARAALNVVHIGDADPMPTIELGPPQGTVILPTSPRAGDRVVVKRLGETEAVVSPGDGMELEGGLVPSLTLNNASGLDAIEFVCQRAPVSSPASVSGQWRIVSMWNMASGGGGGGDQKGWAAARFAASYTGIVQNLVCNGPADETLMTWNAGKLQVLASSGVFVRLSITGRCFSADVTGEEVFVSMVDDTTGDPVGDGVQALVKLLATNAKHTIAFDAIMTLPQGTYRFFASAESAGEYDFVGDIAIDTIRAMG